MTGQGGKNTAVSVRDRLLKLARQTDEHFQLILTCYGLERLLYRLSQSEHCNQFILKGAMLFSLWRTETHCPTRDVDLLGFGENDETTLQQIFSDLCRVPVEDDGLLILADSIAVAAEGFFPRFMPADFADRMSAYEAEMPVVFLGEQRG